MFVGKIQTCVAFGTLFETRQGVQAGEIKSGSSFASDWPEAIHKPSLIQWGKPDAADPLRLHPRNSLPRSGVTLQSIAVTHPTAAKLQAAFDALGLADIALQTGPANLRATLHTPKGLVELRGLEAFQSMQRLQRQFRGFVQHAQ